MNDRGPTKEGRPRHAARDQAAEILRLYQDEGLSMVEVAARLGITEWRVWRTLHREGARLRPKGRARGRHYAGPPAWLGEARRLYEGGQSLAGVAAALGLRPRRIDLSGGFRSRGGGTLFLIT